MKKLLCALTVVVLLLVGCGVTQTATPAKETPVVDDLNADLISISELTIRTRDSKYSEIMGTATNNNKKECSFDFEVIFINPDGTPLTAETLQAKDIKPGETKHFSGSVMDVDISKATHKTQFGEFFTYTKTK